MSCDQCQGRLFPCDTLSGHTTCVECARRNIATAIRLRDRGQSLATAAHPDEGARVEACGDEVSTDPGTHGHRLFLWRGRSAVAA